MKARYAEFGAAGLFDRSHAPATIPHRTPAEMQEIHPGGKEGAPDVGAEEEDQGGAPRKTFRTAGSMRQKRSR
jgi:hypothetical protein